MVVDPKAAHQDRPHLQGKLYGPVRGQVMQHTKARNPAKNYSVGDGCCCGRPQWNRLQPAGRLVDHHRCAAALATKVGKTCDNVVAGEGLAMSGNTCCMGKGSYCPAWQGDPRVPIRHTGSSWESGGAFMPATVLDPAEESSSGGLERASVMMLSIPAT